MSTIKIIKSISVIAIAVLISLGAIFSIFVWSLDELVYDRTYQWDVFNKEIVSNYFKLPDEAEIIDAKEIQSPFMGFRFKVIFRLPDKKKPEEWINEIVTKSNISDKLKVNNLLYDCKNKCDLFRLQYNPETNYYEVEAGWD